MTTEVESPSNLSMHTRKELAAAGLFNPSSDYGGMIGKQVQHWIDATLPGHSGASIGLAVDIFNQVVRFSNLTPLTDDPDEWYQVHDGIVGVEDEPLWQNKRKSSCFSNDGGKTYYDTEEPLQTNGIPVIKNTTPKENFRA